MAQTKSKRSKVAASSGNVFKDLNLPDAEERQTKVQLAVAINRELTKRECSQAAAAEVLGINQPKVSALQKYRLEGFSVKRLMSFLTYMGEAVR
jgi:predicted XRE-type DNA-binding protein